MIIANDALKQNKNILVFLLRKLSPNKWHKSEMMKSLVEIFDRVDRAEIIMITLTLTVLMSC